MLTSHRNSEESETYSQKFDKEEVNTWSRKFQGIRGKENVAWKENQDGEESQPDSERERGSKQLVGVIFCSLSILYIHTYISVYIYMSVCVY